MTPLLGVTTVFGLGAICNLFDSRHRAVTEQNILNVHICYPDTIDQGQLGSNRQYIQGCCKLKLNYVWAPNSTPFTLGIFRWHTLCTGNLWVFVIKSRSSKEAIWFVFQVWCICEGTDAKLSTPGIQRQEPWQSNLLYYTIYAWGFVGMKSLQTKPALISLTS